MREPWFWRNQSITAKVIAAALSPLSALYDLGQRARWKITSPVTTAAPIICIGNATLGGVGKTPFAITLYGLLREEGLQCQFLTRGYGGVERGPLKANPADHNAADIGDEALLLARCGPVWVARDRRSGAKAAAHDGAEVIIMDDGFQNPTVQKAFSVLLIDAEDMGANGLVFPAGPFREPIARAQSRADVTVYVGQTKDSAQRAADHHGSPFAAWLEPREAPPPQRVMAFSGIGKPERFFTALRRSGFDVAETAAFPDHHPFTVQNLSALATTASKHGAAMITTEKDHVRLASDFQESVLTFPVRMKINQPALFTEMIRSGINQANNTS
jgi:tetraacyldisaccharide 4'-kinase